MLGKLMVVAAALAVALTAIMAGAVPDDAPAVAPVRLSDDDAIGRREDDGGEVVAIEDGDDDRTRGNDGTNGGNNTGDGDATAGNDGTNGGKNTGGGGGTNTGGSTG